MAPNPLLVLPIELLIAIANRLDDLDRRALGLRLAAPVWPASSPPPPAAAVAPARLPSPADPWLRLPCRGRLKFTCRALRAASAQWDPIELHDCARPDCGGHGPAGVVSPHPTTGVLHCASDVACVA